MSHLVAHRAAALSSAQRMRIRSTCLADCLLESALGTKDMYIKACQIRQYLLVEGCLLSGSFNSSSAFYRDSTSECSRGRSFLLYLFGTSLVSWVQQ